MLGLIETSTSKGGKTRQRKPRRFAKEWIKLFLDSTNANSMDDHAFFDPYARCRDAKCLDVTSSEVFYFFYCNREKKILVCNPWKNNLAKLIFLQVFVDLDVMKALFQCYNPATKSFHRKDGIVLCTLDQDSFIEAFGLTSAMGQLVDLKDLQRRFVANPNAFIGASFL